MPQATKMPATVELYLAPFYLGGGDSSELPVSAWNGAIDGFTKNEAGNKLFFPGWFDTLNEAQFQADGTPDPQWFDEVVHGCIGKYSKLYAENRPAKTFKLDNAYVYYRYPALQQYYFVSHIAIEDETTGLWTVSVQADGKTFDFQVSLIVRIGKPL